jgi:hypothetical protein
MTDETLKTLMQNLPAIIAAVTGLVAAIYAAKANAASKANTGAIEVVRQDVNDKMQQLITTTGAAEHAKGLKEGEALPQHPAAADEVVKVAIVDMPEGSGK